MDALKLAFIITGSIVAAAGIILMLWKLLKKKKAVPAGDDFDGNEELPDLSWDSDDFSELEVDDAACDQCENPDCDACQTTAEDNQ